MTLPFRPSVGQLVGWLVGRSLGWSVCLVLENFCQKLPLFVLLLLDPETLETFIFICSVLSIKGYQR